MTQLGEVLHAAGVRLTVSGGPWAAALSSRDAVAAHWARRLGENPGFFNGRVHVLSGFQWHGDTFQGRFVEASFAEFLAWRDGVFEDADVRDSFGSGVLIASDGAVLLGTQGPGNLNTGKSYPPGGFIDPRDVGECGQIAIFQSVARELAEEVGIDVSSRPMFLPVRIVFAGRLVAFGICWRLAMTGEELLASARAHLDRHPTGELADVVLVRTAADLDRHCVPEYAQLLVRDVLEHHPGS